MDGLFCANEDSEYVPPTEVKPGTIDSPYELENCSVEPLESAEASAVKI